MDRRAFLRAAPAPSPSTGPLYAMPGQRVPDDVAARWRQPRAEASDQDRAAAQRGSGGEPLRLTSGLAPYVPTGEAPWTRARACQLLKRTSAGATAAAITAIHEMSPGDAVDLLVDGARALSPPADPAWRDDAPPHWTAPQSERDAYWEANNLRVAEYRIGSLDRILTRGVADPLDAAVLGFQETLMRMWHNHVVTDLESHFMAPWLFRYWALIRRNALGNVRTLIHEIGRDPAMLIYLNGIENQAGPDNQPYVPNENYARELFELFTMGITAPDGAQNYTQQDVTEASRALSGWGVDYFGETDTPLDSVFVPYWHDDGQKTLFGETGPWGYDDVVRLIFERRGAETAHFVCRKLYRTLVHDVPDEGIVAELAALLIAEDFELAPVVRTLLASEHFFDAALQGASIKSPIEMLYGLWREIGLDPELEPPDFQGGLNYATLIAGQELFQPPNVAGWPGGRTWIDTSRLTARWETCRWLFWRQDVYRELASHYPNRWTASALAADLAGDMLGLPVEPELLDQLTEILLNGQPDYEWDPTSESAENRIRQLVAFLTELPEYQLQ